MKKIFTLIFILSCLISFGQVTQQQLDAFDKVSTGTNTYSVSINAVTASTPYDGQKIWVRFTNANTGAATLKVNGAGTISYSALPITLNGSALVANDIGANQYIGLVYYLAGTSWQLQRAGAGAGGGTVNTATGPLVISGSNISITANTFWETDGNAGTVDGTNFIGTTDNIPFNVRVNNQESGKIDHILFNTFWGYQSGDANVGGTGNVGLGFRSLNANISGTNNTGVGFGSLFVTTGISNTGIGFSSLLNNSTGGNNTALGYNSLTTNTTGSSNTAIGQSANVASGALTNATAIGANASVSTSNSLVLGNAANVGIGTSSPLATLHVAGASGTTVRIVDGNQGAGKVLTSDADGDGTWATPATQTVSITAGTGISVAGSVNTFTITNTSPSSLGWLLLGNAGTTDATNFLGTTDDKPLNFRVNNLRAGRITSATTTTDVRGVFLGQSAGAAISTGDDNTGIGFAALQFLTTGLQNTAVGSFALQQNINGLGNVAMGYTALNANTYAGGNTGLGYGALSLQDYANGNSGWYTHNTAVGSLSLYNNNPTSSSNGYRNTALGYSSGLVNTTGSFNVFLGYGAGETNTTGGSNTIIGYNADVSGAAFSNSAAIGANALVSASNSIVIGGITGFNGGTSVNVGIGLTAPVETFHVYKAADVAGLFQNSTAGTQVILQLFNSAWSGGVTDGASIDFQAGDAVNENQTTFAQISGYAPSNTPTGQGAFKISVREGASLRDDYVIDESLNTHTWGMGGTSNMALGTVGLKIGNTTAATARLHLIAGTTAASTAPLKFISGSLMTSPEVGAVEFLTDDLYFTITTGTARHKIARVLTGSATLNFANLAAIGCEDLTLTVTGAVDGDEVALGVPNVSIVANSSYSAWVSAANTVTVRFCTFISGDPASGTFQATVIKN